MSNNQKEKSCILSVQGITRIYRLGKVELNVLRGVDFSVQKGEFVAIYGHSGSGKSTLLHIMGLLDKPNSGQITLNSEDVTRISRGRRNRLRNKDIGFIFQFYQLLPELNVLENTCLPAMVGASMPGWFGIKKETRNRAVEILEEVGLANRLMHRPKQLSGGERQRVAIARALLNKPGILLADEPTGNLDFKTGKKIIDMLQKYNRTHGQTIVMITHDRELAEPVDRIFTLQDGRIIQQDSKPAGK